MTNMFHTLVRMHWNCSEIHQLKWNSITRVSLQSAGLSGNPCAESASETQSSTYLTLGVTPVLPKCPTQHRLCWSSRWVCSQVVFQWAQVFKMGCLTYYLNKLSWTLTYWMSHRGIWRKVKGKVISSLIKVAAVNLCTWIARSQNCLITPMIDHPWFRVRFDSPPLQSACRGVLGKTLSSKLVEMLRNQCETVMKGFPTPNWSVTIKPIYHVL